ncbi:hypothetical protein MAP00_000480 [Monascus purpureus]|nr:hypothetical protein MAP00_000480 [Monascus purpureus]
MSSPDWVEFGPKCSIIKPRSLQVAILLERQERRRSIKPKEEIEQNDTLGEDLHPLRPNPEEHPDVIEPRRARDALHRDPLVCIDVGTDEAMRSPTLDNEVIDAIGLPPRLLKVMLDMFPYNKDVEARYRGVDGTKVPKDQWMNPDPSPIRKPLAPEVKEREKKWYEEHRELIDWRPFTCYIHLAHSLDSEQRSTEIQDSNRLLPKRIRHRSEYGNLWKH